MSAVSSRPTFETARAAIAGVEGWLTDGQARMLWDAAAALRPPARIVEIGSFRGRSTIVLALAAAEGVEVVAIDPHGGGDRGPQEIDPDAARGEEDNRRFRANLERAGVLDRVRHVRLPSQDALGEVPDPIDVLYVDGAHRYVPARDDIARWGARVPEGGVMLIHDSFNAIGVTLAALRLLTATRAWRYAGRSRSLARYDREPLTAGAAVASAGRQVAQLPWFARNGLIKVALVAKRPALARRLGSDGDWPY